MDQTPTLHPAIRLLDELAGERIDPIVPKAMVFDRLLDLRNLVADRPLLVSAIDERLREVPGATLTPGAWWKEQLRALRAIMDDADLGLAPLIL
jgi:hypothetical protein